MASGLGFLDALFESVSAFANLGTYAKPVYIKKITDKKGNVLATFGNQTKEVLNEKVESSYVYNFNTRTMGHDPNLIFPGQQLILIHFSEEVVLGSGCTPSESISYREGFGLDEFGCGSSGHSICA